VTIAEVLDLVVERLYADTFELDQFGRKHEGLAHQLYPLLVFSMFEIAARMLLKFINETRDNWHASAEMAEPWIKKSQQLQARDDNSRDVVNCTTEEMLVFALHYAARAIWAESFDPRSVKFWPQVRAATKIRDNIMHPRSLNSLDVTQAQIDVCNDAVGWLLECLRIIKTPPGERADLENTPRC
jgi:hypothetical protein